MKNLAIFCFIFAFLGSHLIAGKSVGNSANLKEISKDGLVEASDIEVLDTPALNTKTPNVKGPDTKTPNVKGPDTKTSNVVDQSTKTPDVVDQSTKTPDVVDQSTKTPDVVDQSTNTPDVVDQSTKTPDVVDQSTKTPDVVDQSTKTHDVVDQSTKTPDVVDQSTKTPDVVDQSTKTPDVKVPDTKTDPNKPTGPSEPETSTNATAVEVSTLPSEIETPTTVTATNTTAMEVPLNPPSQTGRPTDKPAIEVSATDAPGTTKAPTTEALVKHKYKMSGGATAGIIVAVLAVFVVLGGVYYHYSSKRLPKTKNASMSLKESRSKAFNKDS